MAEETKGEPVAAKPTHEEAFALIANKYNDEEQEARLYHQ